MKHKPFIFVFVTAFGLLVQSRTFAQSVALTKDQALTGNYASLLTYGWEFTPTVNISVTALGVYDFLQDGLALDNTVRLWTINGTELAHTVLNAGSHTLISGNAFNSITPVNLQAGNTYVISLFMSGGSADILLEQGTNIAAPGIIINTNLRRFDGGDVFPSFVFPNQDPQLGANFMFQVAVPEPATIGLIAILALGGAAWIQQNRRRNNKQAESALPNDEVELE